MYTYNYTVLTHFSSANPISRLPQANQILPMLPERYKMFSRPTVQAVESRLNIL